MTAWLAQRERGSSGLMRLIGQLTLRLGRPVGRLLLPPICLYFLASSGAARRASRDYLGLALARPARLLDVLRHYHCFASVILDRIFFLTGRFHRYAVTLEGEAVLRALTTSGRGCILLSAHLGSFEALRALAVMHAGLDIKALMYRANARRINAAFDALNPGLADSVIELGSPSAMLQVKELVERGGMAGMLADRWRGAERTVEVRFLGRPAWFPTGPLMMAAALKVPVVLVFATYRGRARYTIEIEAFADTVALDRRSPPEAIVATVQRFADAVERRCRAAPYNWFNFYDFWQRPSHD